MCVSLSSHQGLRVGREAADDEWMINDERTSPASSSSLMFETKEWRSITEGRRTDVGMRSAQEALSAVFSKPSHVVDQYVCTECSTRCLNQLRKPAFPLQ
jgi:hypothetical protein